MRAVLRNTLPYALSLLVILTGMGVAESRGMDRAVGQMVLCTGNGPVMVYVDEDGQPTRAPHYCPDYALSLLGAVHPDQASLPQAPAKTVPELLRRANSLIAAPVPQHPARAPPATA